MKHPRSLRAMLPSICLIPILLLWGLPINAEVSAELSHSTTNLDEPVRLKILITGGRNESPDLSVLTEDFDILGRSQQQSISVVNGRKTQTLGLILVLLAKKSGILTVPAIPVGNEETDKLTLEVLPGRSAAPPAAIQQPYIPPYQQSYSQPVTPQPAIPPVSQPTYEAEECEPCSNWLTWLLGIAWLATLFGWWLSLRGKKKATLKPTSPPIKQSIEQTPKDELQGILNDLDHAYQNNDHEAAREAWINWGKYHWPNNPPSNLNRLAERSPQPVAEAVLSLDRAFYSPENQYEWLNFKPSELIKQVSTGGS